MRLSGSARATKANDVVLSLRFLGFQAVFHHDGGDDHVRQAAIVIAFVAVCVLVYAQIIVMRVRNEVLQAHGIVEGIVNKARPEMMVFGVAIRFACTATSARYSRTVPTVSFFDRQNAGLLDPNEVAVKGWPRQCVIEVEAGVALRGAR